MNKRNFKTICMEQYGLSCELDFTTCVCGVEMANMFPITYLDYGESYHSHLNCLSPEEIREHEVLLAAGAEFHGRQATNREREAAIKRVVAETKLVLKGIRQGNTA